MQRRHESSSAFIQLHCIVSGGGGVGSVMGVWGGVIARVAPTREIARRSMSDVELVVGVVLVVVCMVCLVASCDRKHVKSWVTDRVLLFGICWMRWSRAEGTCLSVCSRFVARVRDREKR